MFRRAARLLLMDPSDGAVLLFQYEDAGRTWWATPGGGLDGDESFEDAANREAAEELGLLSPRLTPLWELITEFSFRGEAIRQLERYFLIVTARRDLAFGPELQYVHVSDGIIATRWWSTEAIESTSELVFPEDLAFRLRALKPHT